MLRGVLPSGASVQSVESERLERLIRESPARARAYLEKRFGNVKGFDKEDIRTFVSEVREYL